MPSHPIRRWSRFALFAIALNVVGAPAVPVKPFIAYHDGGEIVFTPEHTGTHRIAGFGGWKLGERLSEGKPLDTRLNLYVVLPGTQYRSAAYPEYDHNRVVNKYTVDGKVREWDIFWCFVLDPTVSRDLRSESDLLMAAHQTFHPADLFDISDIPAHQAIAEKLGISNMDDLRRFRRKNHSLPRLLIVPARLAVRATAEPEDVTITTIAPTN